MRLTPATPYRLRANFRKHFRCLGGCICRPRMVCGNVTNVQIAARVNGDAVRGDKLRRPLAFLRFANAGLQLPM